MLLLSAGFWQLLQAAGAHAGVNVLLVILQGLGLRLTDLCRPWPAWQRCAFMSCICAGCGLLDHHAALGRSVPASFWTSPKALRHAESETFCSFSKLFACTEALWAARLSEDRCVESRPLYWLIGYVIYAV